MAEENGALDSLKALKGNKKVVVYVGGIAAAYVGYRYWKARQAPVVVPPAADTSVAQGGGGAAMPNDNVGNSVLNTPATNAEWTQNAVNLMTQQGWDPQTVAAALGKYLNAQGLTDQEIVIVQAALALAGHPPNGSYGLIRISNPPPPNKPPITPPPTVNLTAPTGVHVAGVTRDGVTLWWNPVRGATGYTVTDTASGHVTGVSTAGYNTHGLRPNTRYTYIIRATAGGHAGSGARITFTTKR